MSAIGAWLAALGGGVCGWYLATPGDQLIGCGIGGIVLGLGLAIARWGAS